MRVQLICCMRMTLQMYAVLPSSVGLRELINMDHELKATQHLPQPLLLRAAGTLYIVQQQLDVLAAFAGEWFAAGHQAFTADSHCMQLCWWPVGLLHDLQQFSLLTQKVQLFQRSCSQMLIRNCKALLIHSCQGSCNAIAAHVVQKHDHSL